METGERCSCRCSGECPDASSERAWVSGDCVREARYAVTYANTYQDFTLHYCVECTAWRRSVVPEMLTRVVSLPQG